MREGRGMDEGGEDLKRISRGDHMCGLRQPFK